MMMKASAKRNVGTASDLWTTADIARACGVSQSFVRQLSSEGFVQKASGSGAVNYFEAAETIQKIIGRIKQQREPSAHELASQAAKLGKLEAESRRAQMNVDEMRGRLVDINEVTRLWKDLGVKLRERLRNLGSRLAPLFAFESDVLKIRGRVDQEIDATLRDLERIELAKNGAGQYQQTEED
jgi:hypothetical protein